MRGTSPAVTTGTSMKRSPSWIPACAGMTKRSSDNTNGGGLSYTHSGMYGMFTLIELTRQLRGEAGERQVKDAKIGIAHGPGGMFAAASTLIAGNVVP